MDADGACYLYLKRHNSKSQQIRTYPQITIEFGQKDPLLLELISQIFCPPKKVYVSKNKKEVFHKLSFSSQKHILFWIFKFLKQSLQSRKYWQMVEIREVFEMIRLKKHLLPSARLILEKHQLKMREIRIPDSNRYLVLPWSWTTVRFRLTLLEMQEIDFLIKEPKRLSYKDIGKKYDVSRQTISRYINNPLYYKQKLKNVTKL